MKENLDIVQNRSEVIVSYALSGDFLYVLHCFNLCKLCGREG